jgi:hypothetical protein
MNRRREIALYLLIFLAIAATFALVPMPGGDDWETFYGAAHRMLDGHPLYGAPVTHAYYSNPPWLALAFVPASLLPFRWGLGLLAAGTLFVSVLLIRRYAPGGFKLALFLLSPPSIYILIHGQIDILILAGVLLPREWWPLLALTKPQVAVGLLGGVPRAKWLRAGIIAGVAILGTMLLFGPWPLELLRQPTPFRWDNHNLWLGLSPFQVPLGVALLLLGIERNDERFLFSASPFFLPYAAISSLIGPWLAALSRLKSWQAGLIWLSWWGAVLYRGLGGP